MSRCRSGLIDAKRSLSKAGHENPHDEAYKLKNPVKSRIFGLDEAKNDEFTTDLPQLTQDTSEKKTLPAMAVFFYAPYFE